MSKIKFTALLFCSILITMLSVSLCACGGNSEEPNAGVAFTVSPVQIKVGRMASSSDINVTAPSSPSVSSDCDWATAKVYALEGAAGSYIVRVAVAENTTTDVRIGTVTVLCGADRKGVEITQEGVEIVENPDGPQSGLTASQLAQRMGAGINIGNTLEAIGGENAWGAPNINNDFISGLKRAGFNCVRIPVAWSENMDSENVISEKWLNRVAEVVEYCVEEGMYVLVNDHWDNGWIENDIPNGYNSAKAEKLKAMWTQVANKLGAYDQHVLFAGFNEPNAETQEHATTLMKYEQDFVDAVRATGGNNLDRVLVVQAPNTSLEYAEKWLELPDDASADRLMIEAHYYTPYNFCLMEQDASWGNTFWFWGKDNHMEGSDHNPTWGEEDQVDADMKLTYNKFVSKGVPVVLGEYAPCQVRNLAGEELALHLKSRCYWAEYVTKTARAKGMVTFYWDTPGGIIDRRTGAVNDNDMVDAIMRGAK